MITQNPRKGILRTAAPLLLGATAILPRKSSPTWAVRRNAPKHAFNSFAASRLQPFLPSRWKHDWQMASRSTSQIMHCCHRPWCVWRSAIDRRSRNTTPSLSEYLELQSKRIDAEASQLVLRGHHCVAANRHDAIEVTSA